jgi:hypothetical protein
VPALSVVEALLVLNGRIGLLHQGPPAAAVQQRITELEGETRELRLANEILGQPPVVTWVSDSWARV